MKTGKGKKEAITSFRDMVLEESKKGNVVLLSEEGPMIASLKEIIEQPTDGILYDLNRNEAAILTFIEDPKWVNDYAVAQVIRELKSRLESQFNPGKNNLKSIEVCEQGEIIVMAIKGKNIIDVGMECVKLANYLKLSVRLYFNESVIQIFRNTKIEEIIQKSLEKNNP
jgi:hypothetical protein